MHGLAITGANHIRDGGARRQRLRSARGVESRRACAPRWMPLASPTCSRVSAAATARRSTELMPLVDGELRRIARSFMRRQQPGHTLQPTALVNEAFLKVFHDAAAAAGRGPRPFSGAHGARDASDSGRPRARARRRQTWRSCGPFFPGTRTSRSPPIAAVNKGQADWTCIARWTRSARGTNCSPAGVMEMHYFGGMTAEEAALALGRSVHLRAA